MSQWRNETNVQEPGGTSEACTQMSKPTLCPQNCCAQSHAATILFSLRVGALTTVGNMVIETSGSASDWRVTSSLLSYPTWNRSERNRNFCIHRKKWNYLWASVNIYATLIVPPTSSVYESKATAFFLALQRHDADRKRHDPVYKKVSST